MNRLFTEHPRSVGESYPEHMGVAFGFGAWMVLAGLACLVHGVLPFMFVKTGSRTIAMLHDRMIANRVRTKPLPEGAGDRKSGVEGKSVSVRVDIGGRRFIKKNKKTARRA